MHVWGFITEEMFFLRLLKQIYLLDFIILCGREKDSFSTVFKFAFTVAFGTVFRNFDQSVTVLYILMHASNASMHFSIKIDLLHQVCLSRTNQHWLIMHLMTTTWSIGRPPLFWTRRIKEALHIRKEGRQSLNRDEGSYMLSHTYDWFLATSHHHRGKNRKRNWTNFFWWRSLIETETSR